jgi:hypothetical protein
MYSHLLSKVIIHTKNKNEKVEYYMLFKKDECFERSGGTRYKVVYADAEKFVYAPYKPCAGKRGWFYLGITELTICSNVGNIEELYWIRKINMDKEYGTPDIPKFM